VLAVFVFAIVRGAIEAVDFFSRLRFTKLYLTVTPPTKKMPLRSRPRVPTSSTISRMR